MNKLNTERRSQVVRCLVEGNSIRSTVRMTGVAKNTIVKLLVELGYACDRFHDQAVRGVAAKRLQVDEIWAFVQKKQKNVKEDEAGEFGIGDVWTFVAIDPETKLVPSWMVGWRDVETATTFLKDVADRLTNRIQLTTDGHKMYVNAVAEAFGSPEIDFAQLVKLYGAENPGAGRYSPPKCTGTCKTRMFGNPDPKHVSTSLVERQNLTMRMSMRRFTRLTNAFSKKVENLEASLSIHYLYYNFARVHQTTRTTPAMAAGVADHLWGIEEIVRLLD